MSAQERYDKGTAALIRLATLVAIETPARWTGSALNKAYVRRQLIDAMREELETIGVDWRELKRQAERIAKEQRAARTEERRRADAEAWRKRIGITEGRGNE